MKKLLVIAVVAALASMGFAQGGGMRMFGNRGGGLLNLAIRADVAKELGLNADQKTKLDDLQQQQRDSMRTMFQSMGGPGGGGNSGGGTPPDRDAMMKMFQDMQDKQKTAMAAILTADQMKRVQELNIQRQGNGAIQSADVQAALGLTDDQKAKIKDLQDKSMQAMMTIRQKTQDQEISDDDARTARQKNQKIMEDELGKILTADQAKKLADMGGKPFTFDTSLDNQGRGGGL